MMREASMSTDRTATTARPSVAEIDRRRARVLAALRPTRLARGFKGERGCQELAAILGVSTATLRAWENGESLVREADLQTVEAWLASGPVYRYAAIDRVVGPEQWPMPLPRRVPVGMAEPALKAGAALSPT